MFELFWFFVGLVAALPLLWFCEKKTFPDAVNLLGAALVVAAMIYVFFAAIWGDLLWLKIELCGVLVYSGFYYAALKRGVLWLALGWLLHPVWDLGLHLFGPGSHVAPNWYSMACLSFDLMVAAYCFIGNNRQNQRANAGQSF